jgi:hypothetical protein
MSSNSNSIPSSQSGKQNAFAASKNLSQTSSMPLNSSLSSTNLLSPTIAQSTTVKTLVKDISDNLSINGEEFLKEDFDLKTFSSAIIKTKVLSDHLSTLAQNITTLDKEIREQVSLHHEDLLHQAINIETLEEMLDMVQTRISSLKTTSERLRTKISTPYNELNLRILQLSRLQAACDTLRRIKGILHHSAKLKAHVQAGAKDIVKSAQALNELDFLLRNFDYTGIEVVENDVHFAFKSRREVEEQAQVILDKSLTHQDQSQIGTALQVFYSLGILTDKLVEVLKANEKSFQKASNELLDSTKLTLLSANAASSASLPSSQSSSSLASSFNNPNAAPVQFPGRSTMPNVGSMSQFRAQLWTNVEKLADILYDSCSQIYQLQQILEKKKDLLTNLFYLDEIDFNAVFANKMYLNSLVLSAESDKNSEQNAASVLQYESICTIVDLNDLNSKKSIEFLYEQWRTLMNVLNVSIVGACNQSNYIKQTFQNEYPKLLKLQNDLWIRLLQMNPLIDRFRYPSQSSSSGGSTLTNASSSTKTQVNLNLNNPSSFSSSYELLRKCFYDLENAYLNRSLSHLFDPINLIFSPSSDKSINRNDIDTYIKGIQAQLQTLQYDVFNSNASASSVLSLLKTNNLNMSVSGCSSAFSDKIIANVCKSIQMYANKSEQLLNSLNVEIQQSTSGLNSAGNSSGGGGSSASSSSLGVFAFSSNQVQMKNLDYVNATHDLHEQMTRMFATEKLSKKLEDKLNASLRALLAFEENALNPFIGAASDCVLAILLTMHQEDYSNASATSQSCSLYVKELQQVLQRICRDYLQLYSCKAILNPYLSQMASRTIDLFIRHASILRPMTDSTRARLINDSHQIEAVVQSALGCKLTDLGLVYKQLKAFRHLLQLGSPFEVRAASSLGADVADETFYADVLNESLPHHSLLHYLFSYAPTDFKSPHQSLNWPINRYSEWLDKHQSEKERLMVIKSCLEAYVSMIKQKKEKSFATIYPLMLRLLEKGLQAVSQQA